MSRKAQENRCEDEDHKKENIELGNKIQVYLLTVSELNLSDRDLLLTASHPILRPTKAAGVNEITSSSSLSSKRVWEEEVCTSLLHPHVSFDTSADNGLP